MHVHVHVHVHVGVPSSVAWDGCLGKVLSHWASVSGRGLGGEVRGGKEGGREVRQGRGGQGRGRRGEGEGGREVRGGKAEGGREGGEMQRKGFTHTLGHCDCPLSRTWC